MKNYKKENVYIAANERIKIIFNNFEKIYVSFSGGKDSGVALNLMLDYMKKNKIKKKIGVLFVDLEGQYSLTIEYIKEMLEQNKELLEVFWCCLPLNLRNAVSVYNPFWCCWEKAVKEKWVRDFPDYPVITEDNNPFPFFKKRMEFEEFVPEFGKWYSRGKKTACIVGIRSDESLNRFRTIVSETKEKFQNFSWTTKVVDDVYNCYPIYDWRTEDVWTGNGKFGWNYNKLYDMFYKAGVGIHAMRICQPYGDDQRIGLDLFRIIEAETWAKVVNRVSGANFGNIYCGTKLLGYRKIELPKNHSWKSYTKLLLSSLPDETKKNYIKIFIKFIQYWHRKGCGLPDEILDSLPDSAIVTNEITNRGKKNKRIVRYKRIEDSLPANIEGKKYAPTWRRMAMCILKNDHLCKGLSFTQTKKQTERQKEMMKKYKL